MSTVNKGSVWYAEIPGIPRRVPFAPITNDRMADYYHLNNADAISDYRQQEIEALAEKIRSMPALPFAEAREREMLRLTDYYEAFATLFGIDLREVARTRTQTNATVMYTSPLLLQAMFDDKGREDAQGLTFFESRIQAGGFSFNATSINIIEGYPMSFSVLKRSLHDAGGEYEIDYPAVSLPREAFWRLKQWHAAAQPKLSFDENPILTHIADAFSYRIHDWIHQAILYDASSATRIFQKWSDDSYFVEHFFQDPSMINYEFMSDKIHYLVWQQLFDEHPGIKEILIENTNIFFHYLESFDEWLKAKDQDVANGKLTNFLGYVGLRSLFNIIPIDTLKNRFDGIPRFTDIQNLLPEKYQAYLSKLYEPIDQLLIPFRKGKNASISLQQILDEYVTGLREEFQTQKLMSISGELWKLGKQNKLQELLTSLPDMIIQQINEQSDIRLMDPRILMLLNNMVHGLAGLFGEVAPGAILSRLEVDPSGYFYLMIDQDEIDTSSTHFVTTPYRKEAILIQVPWDYPGSFAVTITRSQNVLVSQVGASEQVAPGTILLINIENKRLAKELLNTLVGSDARVAFDTFWNKLNAERTRGHIALGDAYPYEYNKVQEVFRIEPGNLSVDLRNNPVLNPGYYETKPASRRVARLPGPISMDSGKGNTRRRVLFGCIAENHVQYETLDVFPVDAVSFDKFYQADRSSLPPLRLSSAFAKHLGIESTETANLAAQITFEHLVLINDAIIHGFRGKPQVVKLSSLL